MQELQADLLARRPALNSVLLPSRGQVCVQIAIPQAIALLRDRAPCCYCDMTMCTAEVDSAP